ncbi:MAG: 2-oxoacid:acceptor oxidoreductase family protein, partial [Sulfuricaulis sp.]|nr:2-oxoacid:acceptor oxidoreductase family protein [Sulfuricaulis sp.]
LACSVLDNAGFAQKNGAVMSHIRLARFPDQLHAVRIAVGATDLLIACDIVVAASADALIRLDRQTTRGVVNDHLQPTSDFVRNNDMSFPSAGMRRAIDEAVGGSAEFVNATVLATTLMGDSIATNLFMVGFAWQKGLLPLSLEAIERAIELNGVTIETNKRTFAWGRLAAHDPASVVAAIASVTPNPPRVERTFDELVSHRSEELTRYQDAAYAARYRSLIQAAVTSERALPGQGGFALAVAHNMYKLMAYKDEYEVARLYTQTGFRQKLDAQFEPGYRLVFHMAPPLLAKRDPQTGELRKQAYGPWMMRAFGALAGLRRLRGTWADPFGHTRERRGERQLINDYERLIRSLITQLTPTNHAAAIELAETPALIRGYGHVKDQNIARARLLEAKLLESFGLPPLSKAA